MSDPQALAKAVSDYAMLLGAIAKHASDIAHFRRVLFDAFMAEGFNEAQALELCKSTGLQP